MSDKKFIKIFKAQSHGMSQGKLLENDDGKLMSLKELNQEFNKEFNKNIISRKITETMSKKQQHIQHHKIAVLLSLLLDYAESYPEVTKICESVIDSLYESVEQLRKDTYFQDLTSRIENNVTSDLLMIGLITIKSLIDVKANSIQALELIQNLQKMCNFIEYSRISEEVDIYNHNDLNQSMHKVDTIMRKNYKFLSKS